MASFHGTSTENFTENNFWNINNSCNQSRTMCNAIDTNAIIMVLYERVFEAYFIPSFQEWFHVNFESSIFEFIWHYRMAFVGMKLFSTKSIFWSYCEFIRRGCAIRKPTLKKINTLLSIIAESLVLTPITLKMWIPTSFVAPPILTLSHTNRNVKLADTNPVSQYTYKFEGACVQMLVW